MAALRTFLAAMLLSLCASQAHAQIQMQMAGDSVSVSVRTWRDIPFRTVVRQQYDYSCGSAALATLLRYHYKMNVGEEAIFKSMYLAGNQEVIRKVGFSLLDMKKYLAAAGLIADGYKASLADMREAKVPAITVITVGQYRHFVAIKGINRTTVLIGDPALGLKKVPIAEFEKMWNGVIFAIHPGGDTPVFNAADEWRPWAQAPLGTEMDQAALTRINTNIPTIYQIVQTTALRPN